MTTTRQRCRASPIAASLDQELPEIDLTSPPLTTCPISPGLPNGPTLGLSPSSGYSRVDNISTYFPELEEYDVRSMEDTSGDYRDAEKAARAGELESGEKVVAITTSVRLPEGMDTVGKRIAPQQEYAREVERTKTRKREEGGRDAENCDHF
ncbi:hypothetical protein BDM02DRAFT_3191017 [Thelephora ganbajun]|uniref:Uncharacterized protein n=1 Tax=Thelephora ganbajun TaxID=370292 RepID=A0ACB6Z2T9_THEGA|nr:hypothetical protein BDM02DRAFT_3191017 [Thelephora ganbajun]